MARLLVTMETMHAAGRRTLPPVPRTAADTIPPVVHVTKAVPAPLDATARLDAGQAFVARLRAAAPAFADAAGAESAVVREVVPPARHRRSRCRVVFRAGDGAESDLTFIGERRRAGASEAEELDAAIVRWLAAGQQRDPDWLVADEDAAEGLAVDLTAWLAAG